MSNIRFPGRTSETAAARKAGQPPTETGRSGRGRRAASPWQIPWAGWKDILLRTYEQINKDRVLAVAAGVVFYGLLALFPAITAIVSSYALFSSPATIDGHLVELSGLLPQGALDIVRGQVDRVIAKGDAGLGLAFALSFLLAVWSANGGMKAIVDALNVVYEEDEKRGFFELNAVSLAFTFGGIVAALVAISAVVALPIVLAMFGIGAIADSLLRFGRWPVLILAMLFGLAVLYRYGPSRKSPQWRWLTAGSVFATMSWLAGSAALSYYLANYANYDATYGSLGAAIGLMMWMWMSTIVVLVGAELDAEVEHQTARDSTDGSAKPLGARGARMADTVGQQKTN